MKQGAGRFTAVFGLAIALADLRPLCCSHLHNTDGVRVTDAAAHALRGVEVDVWFVGIRIAQDADACAVVDDVTALEIPESNRDCVSNHARHVFVDLDRIAEKRGRLARREIALPDEVPVAVFQLHDFSGRAAVHQPDRAVPIGRGKFIDQLKQFILRDRCGRCQRLHLNSAARMLVLVGAAGHVGEEAERLVDAIAGDEGRSLLTGELVSQFRAEPIGYVEICVIEKLLRNSRICVNLAMAEWNRRKLRGSSFRARGSFTHPAGTPCLVVPDRRVGANGSGDNLGDAAQLRLLSGRPFGVSAPASTD